MKYLNKGFTLIELLVVIAIIGVLSSIVLASLSNARGKGADSSVKGNLSGIRTEANVIYDSAGCYNATGSPTNCSASVPLAYGTALTICSGASSPIIFANAKVQAAIAAAKESGDGLDSCVSTAGGLSWAIAVQLKTNKTKAWCVDSKGVTKEVNTGSATEYTQATLYADIDAGACES